jgi:hypothetical protein
MLQPLLDDADDTVCFAALLSVAKIGTPAAIDLLVQTLQDDTSSPPPLTPAASPTALDVEPPSQGSQTSTLGVIQAAYRREVRQATPPAETGELPKKRLVRRRYAATVLRNVSHPDVVAPLLRVAAEDDALLQREALLTLSHLAVSEAFPLAVEKLYATARDVRLAALEVLHVLRRPESLAPIMTLVQQDLEALVVARGLEVLGELDDQGAIEVISSKFGAPDRQVRRAALTALATLGVRAALPQLRAASFAHSGELLGEAVKALSSRTKVFSHLQYVTGLWQASWPATPCGKIYVQALKNPPGRRPRPVSPASPVRSVA